MHRRLLHTVISLLLLLKPSYCCTSCKPTKEIQCSSQNCYILRFNLKLKIVLLQTQMRDTAQICSLKVVNFLMVSHQMRLFAHLQSGILTKRKSKNQRATFASVLDHLQNIILSVFIKQPQFHIEMLKKKTPNQIKKQTNKKNTSPRRIGSIGDGSVAELNRIQRAPCHFLLKTVYG